MMELLIATLLGVAALVLPSNPQAKRIPVKVGRKRRGLK